MLLMVLGIRLVGRSLQMQLLPRPQGVLLFLVLEGMRELMVPSPSGSSVNPAK